MKMNLPKIYEIPDKAALKSTFTSTAPSADSRCEKFGLARFHLGMLFRLKYLSCKHESNDAVGYLKDNSRTKTVRHGQQSKKEQNRGPLVEVILGLLNELRTGILAPLVGSIVRIAGTKIDTRTRERREQP